MFYPLFRQKTGLHKKKQRGPSFIELDCCAHWCGWRANCSAKEHKFFPQKVSCSNFFHKRNVIQWTDEIHVGQLPHQMKQSGCVIMVSLKPDEELMETPVCWRQPFFTSAMFRFKRFDWKWRDGNTSASSHEHTPISHKIKTNGRWCD